MYGKQTESAIAALSRLAERYDGGRTRLSAGEIARDRGLQAPSVAKLLTSLSQAGLVEGTPGPGGGYTLARPPAEISLADIYHLFERGEAGRHCPFGGGVCGVDRPCVIHKKLVTVKEALDDLLEHTTLEEFRRAYQRNGVRQASTRASLTQPRRSYRALRRTKHGGR
jgi:Rrf2 family protein